jgi:cation:H+ antiporter
VPPAGGTIWAGVTVLATILGLLLGIAMMHWGASRVSLLLDAVCRRRRLPGTAAGALIGLATASPEVSVSIASVTLHWPQIGLGTALGSNLPALPLIFVIAYAAVTRQPGPDQVKVARSAKPVQAWPYLLVIALIAVLTLPPPWQGLQPVDAVILGVAFAVYLARALRGNDEAGDACVDAPRRGGWLPAAGGLSVLAGGAVVSVLTAHTLIEALGIPELVGGLFITGLLCAVPESIAAWHLTHRDQSTAAAAGAMGDGIVSVTLGFIPAAVVGTPVGEDGLVYLLSLLFLGLFVAMYLAIGRQRRGMTLVTAPAVAALAFGYVVFVGSVAGVLLLQ